jgi:cell shape-determining protein MreD
MLLALVIALLQISFMGALRFGGVVPNILLVLIVAIVVWGAASEALAVAVVGGLLMDLSGGGIFGLAVSSLIVISLAMSALRQAGIDGRALPNRLVMVAIATCTWWSIHIAALGLGMFTDLASWRILFIEVVINCCLALLITERLLYGTRKV